MKINVVILIASFFIVGCNASIAPPTTLPGASITSEHDTQHSNHTTALSTNRSILNLGNYSRVVSDAIVYANGTLFEPDQQTQALHTGTFSSDATLGHFVLLSTSTPLRKADIATSQDADPYFSKGVLEIAADDGSYIKIDSNTGNVNTFMTTVISGNLNVSFESEWAEHYSG